MSARTTFSTAIAIAVSVSCLVGEPLQAQPTDSASNKPLTKQQLQQLVLTKFDERPDWATGSRTAIAFVYGDFVNIRYKTSPHKVDDGSDDYQPYLRIAWWTEELATAVRWTMMPASFDPGLRTASSRPLASGSVAIGGTTRGGFFSIPFSVISRAGPEGADYRIVAQPVDSRKQPVGPPSPSILLRYRPWW